MNFHPKAPAKKYISGESHFYLGRQYRLKLLKGSKSSVKLKGKFIEIVHSEKDDPKASLEDWYLKHAFKKFDEYAQPHIDHFRKHGVQPSEIVIRKMPTRWGSCTPKGKIILNPELIKAPKGCIEYVIVHELCHLVHHNHTQKFIELQQREFPHWEKWKVKLEKLMA